MAGALQVPFPTTLRMPNRSVRGHTLSFSNCWSMACNSCNKWAGLLLVTSSASEESASRSANYLPCLLFLLSCLKSLASSNQHRQAVFCKDTTNDDTQTTSFERTPGQRPAHLAARRRLPGKVWVFVPSNLGFRWECLVLRCFGLTCEVEAVVSIHCLS